MTIYDQPLTYTPIPAQGWQCPVCMHVYSPTTPMCFNCPPKLTTTTNVEANKMCFEHQNIDYSNDKCRFCVAEGKVK